MNYLRYLILLLFLSSCVETVVIGGVATGVLLSRNKTLNDTKVDTIIGIQITQEFMKMGLKDPRNKIGVTINEQRVLLTGVVDNSEISKTAVKIAWKNKRVKEVIDEVLVVDKKSTMNVTTRYAKDSLITSQINSKLLFRKDVKLANFEAITVNGTVYLLGVAKNYQERKRAQNVAAKTLGVKKVVSHIILANDSRR